MTAFKRIYCDDLVEIVHADCRLFMEERFLNRNEGVDLLFADPPFNIGIDYGHEINDCRDPNAFFNWLTNVTNDAFDCLRQDIVNELSGVMFLHGPDSLAAHWLRWADSQDSAQRVAWVNLYYGFGQAKKTNWIDARCHGLAFVHKFHCYKWNPEDVRIETARRKMNDARVRDRCDVGFRVPGTVWGIEAIDGPHWGRVQGNNSERVPGRPNQLPERYLERIIRAYTDRGDLVFDPFCGTGTTATVAATLGRRCVTCDASIDACQLAAARVQRGAVRVKGGNV